MERTLANLMITIICLMATCTATAQLTVSEQNEALAFHNKARREVSSPPLNWSADLSNYAQEWAEYLANNGCQLQHRPRSGQWAQQHGENIYWGSARKFTTLDACKGWYAEIKDYIYQPLTSQNFQKTGHYSQMVWNTSTHLGMGRAYCPNGGIIVVANYSPAGNIQGYKPY